MLGNFIEILLVAFWKYHGGEFGPFGCQQFFLQPSDGEHSASKRDLACHGQVAAYGDLRQRRRNGDGHGNARRRPVLGNRPGRYMDMEILRGEDIGIDAEGALARPDIAQGGLRGLLHHVAQLAGQGQLSFAFHCRGFDVEHVATGLRPSQPGRHANFVRFQFLFGNELLDTEVGMQIGRIDREPHTFAFRHFLRHLSHDVGDFALQVPDAGFPRIVRDDLAHCWFGNADMFFGDAVFRELSRDQVFLGDAQLFFFGIAGDPDHFHPIA